MTSDMRTTTTTTTKAKLIFFSFLVLPLLRSGSFACALSLSRVHPCFPAMNQRGTLGFLTSSDPILD